MTKDFIKNLIAGLTGRVIRVCLSLSVILLLFFALMFGFTLNSSINQKFKDTNERITALIAQQQSTPVGLVSVYTLDGNDRVVEYKGQQTPSAFPAHSNENVTLHVQDFLITFRSTMNSAGREVRI
jgi:hypothetical protein